tara:strand:- start:22317 stop:23039 length:723 start_codon:yes stop_codon:yes gene_type:complete
MGFFKKFAETVQSGGLNLVNEELGNPWGDLTGANQISAEKKASAAQQRAADAGIAEQRDARLAFDEKTQPFVDIGLEAGGQLQNFLSDPMAGLDQINPLVNFLRDQGFEQIQESAAAAGRLGAGDTAKDLTKFNTNLASTIVPQLQNQRFNQLFNVMGSGQNAAVGQGTAALQTGSNVSNLLGNKGAAEASGIIGQANAKAGATNNLLNMAASAYGASSGGNPLQTQVGPPRETAPMQSF